MNKKNLLKIYTPILLAIFLFASCTKSCAKTNTDKDSTIKIAIAQPLEALDPRYTTSAQACRVAKLIYSPLFELGEDLLPKPFLAQNIQIIDDKTYKITIRSGLKFHDNSALTAKDVVYTFSALGSEDVLSPHAAKFDYIDNIKAEGDFDIIFSLKEAYAPFLTDLVAIGIVSQKSCENRSQACRHEYVGSGPYTVKNWDSAKDSLTLSPFVSWFEGQAKNNLLIRTVRDENTRMLELIGKKTDLIDDAISAQNMAELKKYAHLAISEMPGLGFTYLAINLREPKPDLKKDSEQYKTKKALTDKNVRLAIAQAIDFDQIIEKVLLGSAKRASGMIPNGHWAKDPNLKAPAFDSLNAERLLDSAGFKRMPPKNMRFKVVIATTPDRTRQSIAMLYADFLKRVGIDASIRVKDWGALYEDMKQGNFELFSAIWVPVTEPDLYYWVQHSSKIPSETNAGGNRHGYENPEADRLIAQGRATVDQQKRKIIYQELENLMLKDLPYIPLWNENRIVVLNQDRLEGFMPMASGSLINIRKVVIKNQTTQVNN